MSTAWLVEGSEQAQFRKVIFESFLGPEVVPRVAQASEASNATPMALRYHTIMHFAKKLAHISQSSSTAYTDIVGVMEREVARHVALAAATEAPGGAARGTSNMLNPDPNKSRKRRHKEFDRAAKPKENKRGRTSNQPSNQASASHDGGRGRASGPGRGNGEGRGRGGQRGGRAGTSQRGGRAGASQRGGRGVARGVRGGPSGSVEQETENEEPQPFAVEGALNIVLRSGDVMSAPQIIQALERQFEKLMEYTDDGEVAYVLGLMVAAKKIAHTEHGYKILYGR